jgi:hypothetical protein
MNKNIVGDALRYLRARLVMYWLVNAQRFNYLNLQKTFCWKQPTIAYALIV